MMFDVIVQWATILSPIIAVGIAVWTGRKSDKDVQRQIESIKALSKQTADDAIMQIKSLKEISSVQIESMIITIGNELQSVNLRLDQIRHQSERYNGFSPSMHLMDPSTYFQKQEDLKGEEAFLTQQQKRLTAIYNQLMETKKRMEATR